MPTFIFSAEDGEFIAKYGAYGRDDGQFIFPSSIDYDPDRDWFAVADNGNSRVQIIRIPGSGDGGALAAASDFVDRESILKAVKKGMPEILRERNQKAVERTYSVVREGR